MARMVTWNRLAETGAVRAEPLGPGLWRLSEPALLKAERSFFHLVAGRDRACLIDGGWGLGALSLPTGDLPLIAVATHSHFDHIGHLHRIPIRLGHRAEAGVFAAPDPQATQALPWLEGREVAKGGAIDMVTFRQEPCPLTGLLEEGDVIDLGGRRLSVIHTPGHSPGSLSLLDEGGDLFCGDVLLPGLIHDEIPGADRIALRDSLHRIAALPFGRTLGGHGGPMDRAEALDRIARWNAGA